MRLSALAIGPPGNRKRRRFNARARAGIVGSWPCALGGRSATSVSGRSIADRSKDFQVRAPPIGRCSIIPGNRSASTASSSLAFTRSSPIRANPSQGRSQRRMARVRGRRRHGERCRSGGIAGTLTTVKYEDGPGLSRWDTCVGNAYY